MNVLQIFVTKIQRAEVIDTGRGFAVVKLVADIDCYGRKEKYKTFHVSEDDYKMIIEKGYYWG